MNFIEQLDIKSYQYYMTEKHKEPRKLYPEIINDIVKLCVAETAKEIKKIHDAHCPSTANAFTVRLDSFITQAEKTDA